MIFINPLSTILGIGSSSGYCETGSVPHEFRIGNLAMEDCSVPREQGLDDTLADTFPCSDPLSSIPNPNLDGQQSLQPHTMG